MASQYHQYSQYHTTPDTVDTRAASKSNGLAVASLGCGVVGLVLFSAVLGPLAVIFGGVGLKNAQRGSRHHGMALAGVILGIVDTVAFIVLTIVAANSGGFSWHVG
jgi:hypothetical protein